MMSSCAFPVGSAVARLAPVDALRNATATSRRYRAAPWRATRRRTTAHVRFVVKPPGRLTRFVSPGGHGKVRSTVAPATTALLIVVSIVDTIAAVVSGIRLAVNAVSDDASWSSPIPVIEPDVPHWVTRPL